MLWLLRRFSLFGALEAETSLLQRENRSLREQIESERSEHRAVLERLHSEHMAAIRQLCVAQPAVAAAGDVPAPLEVPGFRARRERDRKMSEFRSHMDAMYTGAGTGIGGARNG